MLKGTQKMKNENESDRAWVKSEIKDRLEDAIGELRTDLIILKDNLKDFNNAFKRGSRFKDMSKVVVNQHQVYIIRRVIDGVKHEPVLAEWTPSGWESIISCRDLDSTVGHDVTFEVWVK